MANVMKYAGKEVEDETLRHTLKENEGVGTEETRASILDTQLFYELYRMQ